MKWLQQTQRECTTKRNDTWRYIWRQNDGRVAAKMIRVGTVSLHIVTDWVDSTTLGEDTDDFAAFELSERICSVVRGLRGKNFHGMELITPHPNHNHEELLENIDVYRFLGQITHE